jgi:NDP-hexose-3-ketoreductase
MKPLINIGILGCASIARRSVIPAIKRLNNDFNLVGIASRDSGKAKACAQEFDTTPFSYDSLLALETLDAVYIPLPNALQAEWINKALDKGKHVLAEKSMTCSLAESLQVNDKAKALKLILMENFQFRFHRQLAEVRSMIASGSIGSLRCVRSSFGFPPFPDAGNIRYQKQLGGGALLDAGAYTIKISQLILGNDLSVSAARSFYDNDRGVDTWGGGFIQQDNGPLFSEIAFGFDQHYQCSLELWGSKGKLTATRLFTAPAGFEPQIILETGNDIQVIKVPADDHFINLLAHFSEMVREPALATDEYTQNINQARLIEEFKNKANE